MKTIYLRQKKSGNFEFSNKKEATISFKTKKDFREWFESLRYDKLIKATYRKSQVYYNSNFDFDSVWKKCKELFS